jgi:hypothetical protein
MDRKAAKELVHIEGWLERVNEITQRGKEAHLAEVVAQSSRSRNFPDNPVELRERRSARNAGVLHLFPKVSACGPYHAMRRDHRWEPDRPVAAVTDRANPKPLQHAKR